MTVRRPSSELAQRALILAMLASVAGCTPALDEPGGIRQEYGEPEDGLAPLVDSPTCFAEEPGCGCTEGSPPISCTHTEMRGDLVLCEGGASYCVEGVWSDCETVESWEVPRPKTITFPSACSPCNPDCFATNDEPDQADITTPPPGITTNNVEFVLGPPRGIRPIPTMTTTIGGIDTDMDGVPDAADDCPTIAGTAAFFGCPTGAGSGGFFHVLPPGTSAIDPLTFNVQLREADVYILIDRTGSMGGEIDNLRTGVTQMMTNIRNKIPDTWFGVGRFDDLIGDGYGTTSSTSNRVYYNLQDLTSNLASAQAAVNTLSTVPSGGDWPEANSQALWAMATGMGLDYFGTQYLGARTGCPAGRWGYPCFRPSVIPIVILISDAESHNGPTGLQYLRDQSDPSATGLPNGQSSVNIGTLTGAIQTFSGSSNSGQSNNYTIRCGTLTTNDSSRDRLVNFTVPTAGTYRFDMTGTSYDAILYLYSAALPLGVPLACDRSSGGGSRPFIEQTLLPGNYTLRIDGHSNDQGNFQLAIYEVLSGNGVANIGNISGRTDTTTYIGDTSSATNNYPTRCNSSNNDNSRDRLIRFTVTTAGEYSFDLDGSSYDTYLYLYSGTSPTSGFISCNDDYGGNYQSYLREQLAPGTYTLRIDGYNNAQGAFRLKISERQLAGVSYAQSIAALNARGIRFIGVNSGNSVARADMVSMGNDTGSVGNGGLPFVTDISSDGTGLTNAIVTAVEQLADYSRMDVDVVVQNVNLLPGIPASALVQSISLPGGCPARCSGTIVNGCSQCLPATSLPFQVTFNNNVITPTAVDQVFNFDLIVRGNLGAIELQRVPVRILVPANAPTTTYMSGSFSRTFDATDTCAIPPTRPDWGLFQWEVSTPGTTNIVFQFRTAETEAELNSQSPITISVPTRPDVPTAAQFVDVGDLLTSMGGQNFLPYMRVTAVLNPDAAGTQAPTLTSMGLQYSCVDSE